jgi:hypothetical protein
MGSGSRVRGTVVMVAVLLAIVVASVASACSAPPGERVTLVWYCWNGIFYPRDMQATPRYWAGWSPAPSPGLDIRRRDDGGFEATGVITVNGPTSATFTADSGAVLPMAPQAPGTAYPAVCLANPRT